MSGWKTYRRLAKAKGSMLAPEDLPAKHARVMRVVDASTPKPMPQTAKPSEQQSSASAASSSASATSASDRADAKDNVSKFTEDFASSDEETSAGGRTTDDGWNVVAAKPKSKYGAFIFSSRSHVCAAHTAGCYAETPFARLPDAVGGGQEKRTLSLTLRTHLPIALSVCGFGAIIHRPAGIHQDSTEERQESRGEKGRQGCRRGGPSATAQAAQKGP